MRKLIFILIIGLFFMGTVKSEALKDFGVMLQTHLGGSPSSIVQLVTNPSTTPPNTIENLDVRVLDDGSGEIFDIPDRQVLVITEVSLRTRFPISGIYNVGLCDTPCGNGRLSMTLDTDTEGFQETYNFTTGMVFSTLPQIVTLVSNPHQIQLTAYGYLARDY